MNTVSAREDNRAEIGRVLILHWVEPAAGKDEMVEPEQQSQEGVLQEKTTLKTEKEGTVHKGNQRPVSLNPPQEGP